ncbi:hypothetical protein BS47DRAFT_1336677 [Hydnum rufescens UP504]|uniref:Assembly factor cbp4 n=1 Tax=Hydnum rufescens UP504 TaxID=1448309 RepID=A0A9P6B8Y3_9AGAM|nr:hypothetical protein BS47DRAFT_1336677 [Hydnum rufescens UP504]
MPAPVAWGRFGLLTVLLIGVGYSTMKFTSPSEKELYDSLAPDLKKKVDAQRAARQNVQSDKEMMGNPDEAKPIWKEKSK